MRNRFVVEYNLIPCTHLDWLNFGLCIYCWFPMIQGKSTEAFNIYREALEMALMKKKLDVLPALYVHLSRLKHMVWNSWNRQTFIISAGNMVLPTLSLLLFVFQPLEFLLFFFFLFHLWTLRCICSPIVKNFLVMLLGTELPTLICRLQEVLMLLWRS